MTSAEQSNPSLKRQVGMIGATALVIGEVIGVGIFLTPAGMAKTLGSPMWLLIIWLLMGVMAVCGALCYGELAARFPEAGGGYVYLREAFGPMPAFLYGWMALLVMDPGLTAALAAGMAGYAGFILKLSPAGGKMLAVGTILVLAAINIVGLRPASWLVSFLTILKVGLLGFVVVWGFGLRLGNWSNFVPFGAQRPGSDLLIGAIAGGIVSAFFSFGGWWDLSKLAGEVRRPAYTLPRALIYGVGVVTAIYISVSAVFLYLVPIERVTSGETFASQAGQALFGSAGANVFSIIVVIAILGSLAAIIMAAPRVYFAMARDGLFFSSAAKVSPRFGTPALAIAIQAAMASLLVLIGTFDAILGYFVFSVVVFIAMTIVGIFVLRRRSPSTLAHPVPGYPITPLFFLILNLVVLLLIGAHSPGPAFEGLLVVLIGIPVYYLLFRNTKQLD